MVEVVATGGAPFEALGNRNTHVYYRCYKKKIMIVVGTISRVCVQNISDTILSYWIGTYTFFLAHTNDEICVQNIIIVAAANT